MAYFMDDKTLRTLEYPKILARLSDLAAFAPSAEKALALRPVTDLEEASRLQAETREALQLLATHPDLTIGGARDIRQVVDLAAHDGVLSSLELLDIKSTLTSARNLGRTFERLVGQFPHLSEIATGLLPPTGLIDLISHAVSDHGEILDSASVRLAAIRSELAIARERLVAKLQRMVSDPDIVPFLQDALITQRDGRYVLPLRAEFKGRLKSIVHDQSSSGATLFVEPLGVVDLNNQNRELQLEERDEERRILAELSTQVGDHALEIHQTLEAIADLDFAFARAKFAETISATEPVLHTFESRRGKATLNANTHPGSVLRIYQARHPLLDPQTVVPIDLELDPKTFALVITGPNTGGKTVTLKTIGLLALMAQSGLHIPAYSGSEISVFKKIYADIGDEQSIEQSLSTFSGHVTNIIKILKKADWQSLVILDELGAGTDPQEGAALARSLLTHLVERKITTLVTTHHPELKAFAHATPGVVNASVEFDLETLHPTYRLTIGLPGRSNALAIAQRLGMPHEIIQTARSELDPADLRAEDLLDEIHHQRELSRQGYQAAEKARQEAEALREELARRLEKIEEERRAILENARLESADELEEIQDELRQARRLLARARQPLTELKLVEDQIRNLEDQVEKPIATLALPISKGELPHTLQTGERVRLRSLNAKGIVAFIAEEEAEIQVGVLRIRTHLSDLEWLGETALPGVSQRESPMVKLPSENSPGWELDLRGKRADEALEDLDRYLDSAYLADLPFVRLIHGKGTGKLRQVIRQAMQRHPHVQSFEAGKDQEGGEGVTIVNLKTG